MKNMTISLLALSVLAFGCKNKDCEDTAADCDSGATEADPIDEPEATQDSCNVVGLDLCYETNEPDNSAWCSAFGATYGLEVAYSADSGCAAAAVTCDLPAAGDFSAAAVAYLADDSSCTGAGGTVR